MKFLKIVLFLILGFNTSAQIELFQLQWATDSSYVIGALPSGEPVWVHVDSLGLADSIYLQGDSLIVLKKGSGQVYRARIWDENDYSSRYDIPNPQLNDLYGDGQKLYYWDGDSWELLDRDGEIGNEGLLGLQQIATNIIGLTSSSNGFDIKHIVGINGIQISTNELDTINIGIDTTLFEAGETQYLNPYVIGGDTSGFYLTIAQDTVLFVATADTTAGTVDIVTGTSPIIITGDATHTPNVTIQNATTSQSGALTSTDWNTFNAKVGGSGASNQVTYFTGTSTVSGSNNHVWDNTNGRLGIGNAAPARTLDVTGAAKIRLGNNNVFVNGGNLTLSGTNNISIGDASLTAITTGNYNVGVGASSLGAMTTGSGNFGLGYQALGTNTTGVDNVAIGSQAAFNNVTGQGNIAIGSQALTNSKNNYSVAIGYGALASENVSGYYNTAISYAAGNGITTGNRNTIVGHYALGQSNGAASLNTVMGYQAAQNVTGNGNVILGWEAARGLTAISNYLFLENSSSTSPLIGGDFSTDRVGINTAYNSIARTLHVTGEVRITDLTTDTPTSWVGSDGDGDLANGSVGNGITLASGALGLTGQALAVHNLGTNGLIARTSSGNVSARTITAGNGISVTNGDGVSGNPTIAQTNEWAQLATAASNVVSSGTYEKVPFTSSHFTSSSGFTFSDANDQITISNTGTYKVTWKADVTVDKTTISPVFGQIFKNGSTLSPEHTSETTMYGTAYLIGHIGNTLIHSYTAGDVIDLRLYFATTSTTITAYYPSIVIERIN